MDVFDTLDHKHVALSDRTFMSAEVYHEPAFLRLFRDLGYTYNYAFDWDVFTVSSPDRATLLQVVAPALLSQQSLAGRQ